MGAFASPRPVTPHGIVADTLRDLLRRVEAFGNLDFSRDLAAVAELAGGLQGQPWTSASSTSNGEAIAEFNVRVAADPRARRVLLPLRDRLTLIRRVGAG